MQVSALTTSAGARHINDTLLTSVIFIDTWRNLDLFISEGRVVDGTNDRLIPSDAFTGMKDTFIGGFKCVLKYLVALSHIFYGGLSGNTLQLAYTE